MSCARAHLAPGDQWEMMSCVSDSSHKFLDQTTGIKKLLEGGQVVASLTFYFLGGLQNVSTISRVVHEQLIEFHHKSQMVILNYLAAFRDMLVGVLLPGKPRVM